MKVLSPSDARALDSLAMGHFGIPSILLMEAAGNGVAELAMELADSLHPAHARRFVLLAGKGDNGGDAHVAARILACRSGKPVVLRSIVPIENLSGDALANARRLPAEVELIAGGQFEPDCLRTGDIIVDGLLGTGGRGCPRPPMDQWIEAVNSSGLPVLAIDCPSGLDCADGSAELAILADFTAAMAYPKDGFFLWRGPELCGTVRVIDIGIPPALAEGFASRFDFFEMTDARRLLPRRPRGIHKYSAGFVIVAGGSPAYPAAPMIAADAAARAGAGMVVVFLPDSIPFFMPSNPGIVVRRLPSGADGLLNADSACGLASLCAKADVIAVGPGMGTGAGATNFLASILALNRPTIIDADALNVISGNPHMIPSESWKVCLTPHEGEAARLAEALKITGYGNLNRIEKSVALSDKLPSGTTLLLKGHQTLLSVRGRNPVIVGSGSPALATAGTGDALCGMTAAFAASGMDFPDAAALAAFTHGLAGEDTCRGIRGTTVQDVIEAIPSALRRISPHG